MAMANNVQQNGLNHLRDEVDQDAHDFANMTGEQMERHRRAMASCDTLKKMRVQDLSPAQKKALQAQKKWEEVKKLITTVEQLHTFGKGRDMGKGKEVAECGHERVTGDLHWYCHKCQVFSGLEPCCLRIDFNTRCPTGKQMDEDVIKNRAGKIYQWQQKKANSQYPAWRVAALPPASEPGTSSGVTHRRSARAIRRPDYKDPSESGDIDREMDTNDEEERQKVVPDKGEVKPLAASTDCLPVIPRGEPGAYADVMSELKKLGEECVLLSPSSDVIHYGVPLDEQWVELINTRLVELSAHWRSQGTPVDVTPPSKDLAVDAAPFEAEKMLLGIAPLKFPAVATQGVRLASFSGESLVRLTQQDLAAWEEQLKYTLHALSFVKTLSTRARVTHQLVHADRNNNQPTPVTQSKRQKRKSTASSPTAMLEDYPLNHVETAAVTALDDAAKAIVETLVSVIVARRRSIVSKTATRDAKIALLTLPIANTNTLA